MKKSIKVFSVSIMAIFFLSSACDKLFGDLTKFDSDYKYFEFKIYPQDATGNYTFHTESEESDLTEIMEDNGFDESNIDNVKLKEAVFEVINADQSINFNAIGSFSASLSAVGKNEVIVAEKNPVPNNTREITLDLKGDDIAEILKEDEFTFKAKGSIDEIFTDTIEVSAKIKYVVKAKL